MAEGIRKQKRRKKDEGRRKKWEGRGEKEEEDIFEAIPFLRFIVSMSGLVERHVGESRLQQR